MWRGGDRRTLSRLARAALVMAGVILLCLASIEASFAQGSTLTQSDYRWYQNRNGLLPLTALAEQNVAISDVSPGDVMRLRMNVLVESEGLAADSQGFKLQYASSTSGPWTDVGAIGSPSLWRGYDNPSVNDGEALGRFLTLLSNSNVTESYEEQNPSALNPREIGASQRGEWDWVLEANNAAPASTYYFRMVKADGTSLSGYTRYPQVTTSQPQALAQSDYRWYQNRDSLLPLTALAEQNELYNATGLTGQYRLRVNVQVSGTKMPAEGEQFKLQYSTSTSGPWNDVGGIGSGSLWRGYDNPSVNDGEALSRFLTLLDNSDVTESYEEQNPSALNPREVGVGEWGEWDWVLEANNAAPASTYYFRMVKSDDAALDSYARYPAIVMPAPTTLTQSDYRWYQNRDSALPLIPLSDENAVVDLASANGIYRLRANILVNGASLAAETKALKLQCSTSTSGPWNDVGGIGSGSIWRGYDNPSVNDGEALSRFLTLLGNSDVTESYEEQNPSALNPREIGPNQRGEWDWVLEDNGIAANTVYYFRMADSNGTSLDGYTRYPALSTYGMNYPPTVDSVSLVATEMTPQMDYTVSVTVSDLNTINDIGTVVLKLWYDGDGGAPLESEFDTMAADAQDCAVITWTADDPGGTAYSGSAALEPASTTWALGVSTLPQAGEGGTPGDFALTSFTFELTFTVGKVATETLAQARWQVAARVTDSADASDFNYDSTSADMSFYGEISGLAGVVVDWGTVNPGTDFQDDGSQQPLGATVTYIANGPYDEKVKSSTAWSGSASTATLDESGNCYNSNEFALKANDTADLEGAVLVDATGTTIDDAGGQTTEAGDGVTTNTLWLKVADTFTKDVYAGTITYIIANGT